MQERWIKVRADIHNDPHVVTMCGILDMDEDAVVSKLIRIWAWAQQHAQDGAILVPKLSDKCPDANRTNVRLMSKLDDVARANGFAQAMSEAGWLQANSEGIFFPKWDVHNSNLARTRALDARRKSEIRRTNVREMSGCEPDQKRKEKRVNPLKPPKGGGEAAPRIGGNGEDPLEVAVRAAFPGLRDTARAGRESALEQAVAALRSAGAEAGLVAPVMALLREDTPRASWRELANRWADLAARADAGRTRDAAEARKMRENAEQLAALKTLPDDRLRLLVEFCQRLPTWPAGVDTLDAALAIPFAVRQMNEFSGAVAFNRWVSQRNGTVKTPETALGSTIGAEVGPTDAPAEKSRQRGRKREKEESR